MSELPGVPFGVFFVQFVEVMMEEAEVLWLRFGDAFGLHWFRAGHFVEFFDVDVVSVEGGAILFFHFVGLLLSGGLDVVASHFILEGGE